MNDAEFLGLIRHPQRLPGGRPDLDQEEAWRWFHETYGSMLRQVIRANYHGCSADIEDIAQNLYVTLYRRLPFSSPRGSLCNYLAGIARRIARKEELRRRLRNRWTAGGLESRFDELLDGALEPWLVCDLRDHRARFERAIESLYKGIGERNSLIFDLYWFEGKKVPAIADIVGWTEDRVRMRLRRARSRFGRLLRQHGIRLLGGNCRNS